MGANKRGRYEIREKLGEGGMGVVFRAYDPPPMDRVVALKTLPPLPDPLALELFYKECRILKSITHPNVVEIFDMGECEEEGGRTPFFVMPLLPGQTLDDLIRHASHRLSVARVVEIMSQTCRGLQAAHDHGLIHRDLKPSNIFVMADDSVKIIDFGVAHAVDLRSQSVGYAKGTLVYMSPEQVQRKPVSPQSDIFSLGVVCYEALTRRHPFRGATEDEVVNAILSFIPPPACDINPSISQTISRVVHKAMAKHPWHRYDSMREFGETLQKALRNEPIEVFEPARLQPRLQRAAKALENGDHQFAGDIIGELEAEGNIDPQLTLLRTQVDQVARQRTIAQLLESARARFEEEEDPLALQKIQEVLRLDPSHAAALGLKSKIDERRSERQIEQWVRLARQHIDNHSYGPAREALRNVLSLRRHDTRAEKLLKDIEADEEEYLRLRRQKADVYQAALNAWKNGDVSHALSQMKVVLDLDRRAPDTSSPDTGATYQVFYNQVRSEHEAINTGYGDARRKLADKDFDGALQICDGFLGKYPGHALFQALKFDVEEQRRQQLSAFIADVDRRLEAEPDLDAKVSLLREAIAAYPDEAHFQRPLQLIESKRELVNSIVARARVHEERGEISEALSDLEMLLTIYSPYPGLRFEQERLQKRLEQQAREAARAGWIAQIDRQLETGEYARALELIDAADEGFPNDAELVELRAAATQSLERAGRAEQLLADGQALCLRGEFEQGIETLTQALQLEDRNSIRATLCDVLVERASACLQQDWRTAQALAERALHVDPTHVQARSLAAEALDRKREEDVAQCASLTRRLQTAGDLTAAAGEIERGLSAYPTEPRLTRLRETIASASGRRLPAAGDEPTAAPAPFLVPAEATIVRPRQDAAPAPAANEVPVRTAPTITAVPWSALKGPRALAAAALLVIAVLTAIAAREPADHPVPASSSDIAPAPAPRADVAREGAAPPAVAPALRLSASDLEGRRVWLNGNEVGKIADGTFFIDAIAAGEHTITIAKGRPGKGDPAVTILTEAGQLPRLKSLSAPDTHALVISTRAGAAHVQGSVADVTMAVDGLSRGVLTPAGLAIEGLAHGAHELTMGTGSDVRKVSFAVGDQPALDVILMSDRNVGSLLLLTDQDDVSVYVDGRLHKRRVRGGQLRLPALSTTTHTVNVVKEGFKSSEPQSVTIVKGQETVLRFALTPLERPGSLAIEGLAPGTEVWLDNVKIGTANASGSVTRTGIEPGTHTLLFTLTGHQPQRTTREFRSNAVVTIADVRLAPAVGVLDVLAADSTEVSITRGDQVVRQFKGPASFSLGEGPYLVTAQGPAGVARTLTTRVGAGDHVTVDARQIVTGLELFDQPERWNARDTWVTRRGGGFVTYNAPAASGTFSFTVRRSRGWLPFSNGKRLRWVIDYVDSRNHVLLQMDGKHFYRHAVIDGREQEGIRTPHGLPDSGDTFHLSIEWSEQQMVHQVSVDGKSWRAIDTWTNPSGSPRGKFGFYLPGDDEIQLANFLFYPPGTR